MQSQAPLGAPKSAPHFLLCECSLPSLPLFGQEGDKGGLGAAMGLQTGRCMSPLTTFQRWRTLCQLLNWAALLWQWIVWGE